MAALDCLRVREIGPDFTFHYYEGPRCGSAVVASASRQPELLALLALVATRGAYVVFIPGPDVSMLLIPGHGTAEVQGWVDEIPRMVV